MGTHKHACALEREHFDSKGRIDGIFVWSQNNNNNEGLKNNKNRKLRQKVYDVTARLVTTVTSLLSLLLSCHSLSA